MDAVRQQVSELRDGWKTVYETLSANPAVAAPHLETIACDAVFSSKKTENPAHAMAPHFLYYNFVRIHKTLRTTPAMAAGVASRLWEIDDIVDVPEAWEAKCIAAAATLSGASV